MLPAGPAPRRRRLRRYRGCIALNDYYHLLRKAFEGQFAKKMRYKPNEAFVRRCVVNLRSMPTVVAFEGLVKLTLAVWTEMGEGLFADYFQRIYLTDPWKDWFLGGMPYGCTSGQQSIEGGHRAIKKIVGPAALRLAPKLFFETTIPKILDNVALILDQHTPELVTQVGVGPVRAMCIHQSQLLIAAASGTPLYRLQDDDEGNAYWALNREVTNTQKMTKHRAELHCGLYDDGVLPLPKNGRRCDQEYYESLEEPIITGVVIVKARKVQSRGELRPWAQHCGSLYGVGPARGAELVDLECACEDFWHNHNKCVHVVALAICLKLVDPAQLIDVAPPRRGPGRPKKDMGALGASSGAPKKKTAASFLAEMRRLQQPMRYAGHKVVVQHCGEYLTGYVRSCTVTKVPKHRITLYNTAQDGATFVDWDYEHLAAGLALALDWGASGIHVQPQTN
mmetsp:Transcript_29987/g.101082  ORF Transcript_29987/g.101082 Transcript_29987/m.101082 type:complete len:451 (+) Transcript_29987:114-1466(+)